MKERILEVKKKIAIMGLSDETQDFLTETDRRFKKIKESVGYTRYKQRVKNFNHQFFKDMVESQDVVQNSG